MRAKVLVAAVVVPLLAAFIALPLAILAIRSLADGPAVYAAAAADADNRRALVNTLVTGGGAALLALVAGAPLGAALARLRLRGARALSMLLVLPIAVPPYVWAMAWIALASPRAGWLNRLAGAPLVDIYGAGGIVWVLGLALYPLVLLPTRAALEAADPALEEAARIGGAGPLRAFATGALPLAARAAASGTLLAFLAAISAFGVPYLLGVATERPVLVATTRVYQALALGAEQDVRSAIALCVLLLALAALATVAASRFGRGAPAPAGKGRRPAPLDAPRLTRAAGVAAWTFAAAGVLLPILSIVVSALTRRFDEPPGPSNLTLAQVADVLGDAGHVRAILHSVGLGAAAASLIVAIGAALAFLRVSPLSRLAEAAYAIPGSVLALAILLAFSREVRVIVLERVTIAVSMMGTLWVLLVAYVVKYLAFGVRAAETAARSVDPALEEAARISGAGAGRAFVDVTLPLARPALAAAWLLAFLPCATELTMSVLLAGPRTPVLGTVLFELMSYADPPSAAVLACVCLGLVVVAHAALRWLGRSPSGAAT